MEELCKFDLELFEFVNIFFSYLLGGEELLFMDINLLFKALIISVLLFDNEEDFS